MNAAPRNHVIEQIDGRQCEVGDCDAVFGAGLMHFRTSGVSSPKLGGAWRRHFLLPAQHCYQCSYRCQRSPRPSIAPQFEYAVCIEVLSSCI
jgi:hypothetical protein